MEGFVKHLKEKFGTGLIIVIPLGITLFILKFLFSFADGILGTYLDGMITAITHKETHFYGLGVVSGILIVYIVGLLATNVLGHHLIRWGDEILSRTPLVKSIYVSSKQLTNVLKDGKSAYRRAVFVEWPRRGVLAVGFVTAEVERHGKKMVVVYVPTMPNPTSGFALFFHEDEVLESDMNVEEAVKFIVSGGMVVV